MRSVLSKPPSPSMVVAFLALFVAVSTTAGALPGRNSVDSGDLRNNQVRSRDLRNNDVRSGDIRNGAVQGRDVRDETLTGSDIDEGTLGQVPSANSANSANTATVAGTVLQTFRDDTVSAPATTPGQNWTLLAATVPAGSYVLTGKATIDNADPAAVEIRCFLRVGDQVIDRANLGLAQQPSDEDIGPFTTIGVHSSATPFEVVLECTNQGNGPGDTLAHDRKIVAHEVASVTSTQASGP